MTKMNGVAEPNRTIENALRDHGVPFRNYWRIKGPENTSIEWMQALGVGSRVLIIVTFKEGGWEAFAPVIDSNDVDKTVRAVFERCGVSVASGATAEEDA